MEQMVLRGIELGLDTMCFTEHMDYDFPDSEDGPGSIFLLQTDPYLYELASLKEKYRDRIKLLFGVELGLQPECMRQNAVFAKSYEFDFIIGSSHICHRKDPIPLSLRGAARRKPTGNTSSRFWRTSGNFPTTMCTVIWTMWSAMVRIRMQTTPMQNMPTYWIPSWRP